MRIPGRRWTGNLVLLPSKPQETEIDYIAPVTPFIAVFPKAKGLYPLKEFNQVVLNFGLWAFPAGGATFVDVTMIKFRGFLVPPDASAYDAGTVATGTVRFEFFQDQYLIPDSVTNMLDPFPRTVRFTAAAPTLVYNGQNYREGASIAWPVCDDFIGFLVESDAVDATGLYTMSATLGWA